MAEDGSKTQLWRNSAYHKMAVKADISIEGNQHKCSDNEMQHSVSYSFAIMIHLISLEVSMTDISQLSPKKVKTSWIWEKNDKIQINYLKISFGKWVAALRDLNSRLTADLKKVTASVESGCRYTITDMWTTNMDHLKISL